jgi:hypothetical protein
MQQTQSLGRPRLPAASWGNLESRLEPTESAPLTPAVTGINYPSPTDASGIQRPHVQITPSAASSHYPPSSDGSNAPITPADIDTLDQLWSSIRLQKERKMEKEPPKVQLFADTSYNLDQRSSAFEPVPETSQNVRKRKSL